MESLHVQTADLRMHYLQEGTGEPVIFLHGFPETSYEWRKQFPALAGDYALFAPDTRGFGGTDKPGVRVNRTMLAQDIVNFMDALDIERAAVVAHDWGGIIAFKLAIDWPERVSRLAMLDTLCTVWAPAGAHGYWFKAEPLPEEFFAAHHRGFIESIFTGGSEPPLPGRPQSPWPSARPNPNASPWATPEDIEEYARAFADPLSHFHAISYYRYGLPFHRVVEDASAPHGERYESLSERDVAEMWLHPERARAAPQLRRLPRLRPRGPPQDLRGARPLDVRPVHGGANRHRGRRPRARHPPRQPLRRPVQPLLPRPARPPRQRRPLLPRGSARGHERDAPGLPRGRYLAVMPARAYCAAFPIP